MRHGTIQIINSGVTLRVWARDKYAADLFMNQFTANKCEVYFAQVDGFIPDAWFEYDILSCDNNVTVEDWNSKLLDQKILRGN